MVEGSAADQPETTAPKVFDGGDRMCVVLLLELREFIEDMAAGTVVHVIATDPAASLDLPAWSYLTGHQYLGAVEGGARATYALRLADRPVPTQPRKPWHRAIAE